MRDIQIERDDEGRAIRLWVGRAVPSGVTPQPEASAGILRCVCGSLLTGRARTYCSRRCKDAEYNRTHPVSRQARLDFTPAATALADAVRGRESKAQRILARLRQGPATTWDLQRITGRFSARLQDLEELGLRYERQDFKAAGNEHSVYTMTQEPREGTDAE